MPDPFEEHRQQAQELVRQVGERIGYGHTMQLCERLWSEKLASEGLPPGSAHSTYCCVAFLVPCPCPGGSRVQCDWCCGAGRVTKRVAEAMAAAAAYTLNLDADPCIKACRAAAGEHWREPTTMDIRYGAVERVGWRLSKRSSMRVEWIDLGNGEHIWRHFTSDHRMLHGRDMAEAPWHLLSERSDDDG